MWYITAANFDQAETSGITIANRRVSLLAPDNVIEYQRIIGSQPDTDAPRPRQQRQATLQRLSLEGQAAVAPDDSDLPWTAVKVRWAANDVSVFRTQLLRGVPDSWFDQGSDKLANAKVKNWIIAMVKSLQAAAATIRHKNPIVPPAVSRVFSYQSVARGTYEGYTRRATGRPFGWPRGRRPKRV